MDKKINNDTLKKNDVKSNKSKEEDKEIEKEISRIKLKIKHKISENTKTKEKRNEKPNLNNSKFQRKRKIKEKELNKTTINENEKYKTKDNLINSQVSEIQQITKNNTNIILDSDNIKTQKTTTKNNASSVYKKIFLYKKNGLGQHFSLCSKTFRTSHSPNYTSKDIAYRKYRINNSNSDRNEHKFYSFYNDNNLEKKTNYFINIEDLLFIEEKFNDVKESINSKQNTANECFELLNSYSQCSLYNNLENYFRDINSKLIIHSSILLCLYNLIIIYNTSFDEKFFNSCYEYLSSMVDMNHKSFLLICEIISKKISHTVKNNMWVDKLKILLRENITHIELNNKEYVEFLMNNSINYLATNSSNINTSYLEIKFYNYKIKRYIKIFLNSMNNNINTENENNPNIKKELTLLFDNLPIASSERLISFFKSNILRVINKNASVTSKEATSYINSQYNLMFNFAKAQVPYLTNKTEKKFTCVLDLDETLISFKLDLGEIKKGTIKFRPGLDEFLQKIKEKYEIIVFTSATREYADPLEDAIEQNNKYFDARLYREHTIIYENEVVKDISRIGRPLDKILIVENMQQNYRLQKENGILIKSFYGEDMKDNCLIALGDILIKIVNEFDDVRKGIAFYKNEIFNKVSSNLSKKKKKKGGKDDKKKEKKEKIEHKKDEKKDIRKESRKAKKISISD